MKRVLKLISALLLISVASFFLYFNNTETVNKKTLAFYNQLKNALKKNGFSSRTIIVSTKRFKWHNDFQVRFSGAARKSRHLTGDAIDFIVLDVNDDGKSNITDVSIVYAFLDKEVIKDKGGIGTYKNGKSFISRQMIHIDCRGYRARWNN